MLLPGGKNDLKKEFDNKNFGVGCRGGVEVVAHSLRNVREVGNRTKLCLKLIFAMPSI